MNPNSSKRESTLSKLDAPNLNSLGLGKLPPQVIQIEEDVLGSVISNPDSLDTLNLFLKPAMFYREANEAIYANLLSMYEHSKPINLMTLTESLRKSGDLELAGGMNYLIDIYGRATGSNTEYNARIIQEKSIAREIIKISTQALREAFEDTNDTFSLLDRLQQGYSDLSATLTAQAEIPFSQQVDNTLMGMRKAAERKGQLGVASGWKVINGRIGGYEPKNFYVIGARPAMGKTSYMLNDVYFQASVLGALTIIVSLEMSYSQLIERLVAMRTGIDYERIRKGQLSPNEWFRVEESAQEMKALPIELVDVQGINVTQIRSLCRKLIAKWKRLIPGIEAILWIDYLQLIDGQEGQGGTRTEVVSKITRGLKNLARALLIPVVVLAQLSRAVESEPDKRPNLSHLRESGSIEQDADTVQFLYRAEYYGITHNPLPTKKIMEVLTAKNRSGEPGTDLLKFEGAIASILDIEEADEDKGVGF